MNGTLDFPCLQNFKLKVLRASKAPPKSTPELRVEGFLERTKPRSPPLKTSPPVVQKFAPVSLQLIETTPKLF